MSHIIEVTDLKKTYGKIEAVKGISFYAETGRLLAFLGPNGAGKSTTIDMICTFLKPDQGTVLVNGFQLGSQDDEIRKSIGAVFQDSLLDPLLTVEENMMCRGALYGYNGKKLREAVLTAMELVGVIDYAKRPYGQLSGGQRRRCDIARALIHAPKILFLDEPTTGLDPQTRQSVWETVQKLQKEQNMTVFLTTHYMEEAAGADYVIVIDNGSIAAKGTPAELCERYAHDTLILSGKETEEIQCILKKKDLNCTLQGSQITIKLNRTLDAFPVIQECLPYLSGFEVTTGTMDDAFIGITGKELRE